MAHWRDTYRPARFFFMDARAGVPLLLCLLHVKVWTVLLAATAMGGFWFLERLGIDTASAWRAVRSWAAGSHRPARFEHKTRNPIDYDRRQIP